MCVSSCCTVPKHNSTATHLLMAAYMQRRTFRPGCTSPQVPKPVEMYHGNSFLFLLQCTASTCQYRTLHRCSRQSLLQGPFISLQLKVSGTVLHCCNPTIHQRGDEVQQCLWQQVTPRGFIVICCCNQLTRNSSLIN